MAELRLRLFYLLSLVILISPIVRATDFPPITDEDKNFKEVPGQPGAPAAVLYKEEIDDDFRNHDQSFYVRIKILTEAGRKYANIEVPFRKYESNIEGVVGRTVHADGTIIPFDGKVYDKEIIKTHDVKVHVKSFTLPDAQVGSIIEYRYHFRYGDYNLHPPFWRVQGPLWVKKAHYEFYPLGENREAVLQYGLTGNGNSWVSLLPEKTPAPKQVKIPSTSVTTLNMGDVYHYDFNPEAIPAYVEEPYMPDSDEYRYYVRFFYVISDVKPENFWTVVGKYWNKDVEKFINKNSGIDQVLATVIAPTDTPEQKVRKIYAYVGGLENQSFTPQRSVQEIKALGMKQEVRGVSDVLQQKSGDRTELTRTFVAMARKAGVPAYVMRVASREEDFFLQSYLNAWQLDAEIAVVQLDGKDVFLDPGTKYCPYGLLDWRHTATRGWRQTGNGAVLADTPAPRYQDAVTQRVGTFDLREDGTVQGVLKVGYFGQDALSHRRSAIREDAEGRKKELEDEAKRWLPAEAEVKLTNEPKWDTAEGPLVAEFSVTTPAASNAGKRALLPALLCQITEKPKFPDSQRTNAIYLYFPWGEVDFMKIKVPANYDIENLPQPETTQTSYSVYKTNWTQADHVITVRRDLVVGGYAFPQTRYTELKGFFDKVKTGDEQQAVLKVSANATGK